VTLALFASCAGPEATLANTRESPEALARAVLAALAGRKLETLRGLALSESEFRTIVWPKLPASRPERNVPVDYAWKDLRAKSDAHLRELVARWPDGGHELVSVEFHGGAADYGTFRVHRETVLALRDATGRVQPARLYGSTIEMKGRCKVFSYVVD
jgi:hypothetical protein